MTFPVFTNNATGTLAAAYSASATALTLAAGQGVKFPSPGAGEWFPITIVDVTNNIEIVHCTGRTADTCTVTRGMEGTAARALGIGEKVEHRLTAGALNAIRDRPIDASQIADGSITTSKLANNAVISSKLAPLSVFSIHINKATIDSTLLGPNCALENLGFLPVQQGGGVGQGTNKINLGWAGAAPFKLRLSVDSVDQGYLLTEKSDGSVLSAGYRGLPQNVQNANWTFALVDSGRQTLHTSAAAHTWTIPSDVAVPLLIGTVIKLVNREGSGNVNIVPSAGIALRWVPSGAIGSRTLGPGGSAVLEKMDGNTWWIYGLNVT
jgi:hypothetical protein